MSPENSIKNGYSIGVLACGTMGTAVLLAILKGVSEFSSDEDDIIIPRKFYATVNSKSSYERLDDVFGTRVQLLGSNNDLVKKSDIIILGCKPFMAEKILADIDEQAYDNPKVIISLLAGKTIATLKKLSHGKAFVARAMTNTPSRIGAGMTIVSLEHASNGWDDESVRSAIEWIFEQTGRCLFLDEKHQDAATALCGSGPAFLYLVLEALCDGGVRMGLPYAVAQECAAQVLIGSGQMVLETGLHPAVLKSQVCTPGGTTIGGLLVMEDNKVRSSVARAVEEAANIAKSFS